MSAAIKIGQPTQQTDGHGAHGGHPRRYRYRYNTRASDVCKQEGILGRSFVHLMASICERASERVRIVDLRSR